MAETVIHLDASGQVSGLSDGAEELLARAPTQGSNSPGDFLLHPDGSPLTADFLATFSRHPDLESLRRSGIRLLVRAGNSASKRVRVTVAPGEGSEAVRLLIHPEPDPVDGEAAPSARALEAASAARTVLLRHGGESEDLLRRLCQAVVDGGYPGAAICLADPEDPKRLRPAAWAQAGSGAVMARGRDALPGMEEREGVGEALRTGKPVSGRCLPPWVEDGVQESAADHSARCLALPLAGGGEGKSGVLAVFTADGDEIGEADRGVLAEVAADLGACLARDRSPQEAGTEGELAGILEAAPDFLAILDPEGRIRYLNSGALALLGRPQPEACHGRLLNDFQPEAAARRFRKEALPAAEDRGTWRGETGLLTVYGTEIPVDQTLVAHRGPDGRTRALFTIIRDISDRKREEARLRDSEEKYRRILEAAQEGFLIVHDQLQEDDRPKLRFKVPVNKGSRIILVDLPEVRYFQADGHYTQVYTGSDSYLCNLSVSELERRLDSSQFIRIHRSYIINLKYIDVLERVDDQWCVTIDAPASERLPVSRRNVEKVKVMLGVS